MKKTPKEKMVEKLAKMKNGYEGLDIEAIDKLIEQLKSSEVKRKTSERVEELMLKRSAAKFKGWTPEKFKAYIEKLTKAFKRCQEMTEEDFAKIDAMNAKAVAARLEAMSKKTA